MNINHNMTPDDIKLCEKAGIEITPINAIFAKKIKNICEFAEKKTKDIKNSENIYTENNSSINNKNPDFLQFTGKNKSKKKGNEDDAKNQGTGTRELKGSTKQDDSIDLKSQGITEKINSLFAFYLEITDITIDYFQNSIKSKINNLVNADNSNYDNILSCLEYLKFCHSYYIVDSQGKYILRKIENKGAFFNSILKKQDWKTIKQSWNQVIKRLKEQRKERLASYYAKFL